MHEVMKKKLQRKLRERLDSEAEKAAEVVEEFFSGDDRRGFESSAISISGREKK